MPVHHGEDLVPSQGPKSSRSVTAGAYGGFLWQHLTMDEAGYEKFGNSRVRAVLAAVGRRCRDLDARAVEHV